MKNKEDNIIGVYLYPHFANKGKVERIINTLKEYRKTAQRIANLQWNYFYNHQRFNKYLPLQEIKSELSERYKQNCLWQVYGVLEGYISNIQKDFVKTVINSNLPREDKSILIALNSRRSWLRYEDSEILCYNAKAKSTCSVTDYHKKLSKKIFHHLLKTHKNPNFKHISMHLDERVALLRKKDPAKAKAFDYWVRFSTLEKGNPTYIPLKANTYAESLEGEYLKFVQIIENDGDLLIKRVKSLKRQHYIPENESISIDLGLSPLFATNKGDLIGRNLLNTLIEFDRKITNRMRYLQKNNIKPRRDKKYCRLIENLRAYLKNETNRMINRLITLYKPAKIIVEKLNFQSPELSKRINRLIQNFGKRYIKGKLNRLKELFSIQVIEINPAYTSQECSNCGYIDKANRKDTQTFECRSCGSKINAQINGARNISKRSSFAGIKPSTPKKKVLQILVKQYLERLNGCNSAPVKLLRKNPYFRDYLSSFKPMECEVNKCL